MKEGRIETLDRTLSTRRVENATRVVEKFMTSVHGGEQKAAS